MRTRLDSVAELMAIVGVGLVLVFVPLLPGRSLIPLGNFSIPVDAQILAVPAALLLCIPYLRRVGAEGLPRIGVEVPALAFLGIALVGIPFAGAGVAGLGTWLRYAGFIALVPLVATIARTPGNRRALLWVLVLAGVGTVVYGIVQYLNPSMLQLIGMQGLDESVAGRVYSTFVNPNFYAEYLVLLVGATLSLAFLERGLLRGLAIALIGCEGFVLLATYTRGSWLALALGLTVAALMIDVRYLWGLVGAVGVAVVAVPGVAQRVGSIFSTEGTASFRLRLWRLAGTIIQQHPVVGVGIGRFLAAFKLVSIQHPELGTGFLIYGAHNSYFTITAETGLLGGIAFLWLVISVARMGVFYGERMGDDMSAKLQNAALTVGLVAFAVNALTSNSFQHPQAAVFFWVLAGLQAGLGNEFWTRPVEAHAGAPAVAEDGFVAGSWVVRGVRGLARFVHEAWEGSDVHRWLVSPSAGDGDVMRGSRAMHVLLPGTPAEPGADRGDR